MPIPSPRFLCAADVQPFDLVGIQGSHPTSVAIREIDDATLDHVGIVTNVEGDEIIFAEQSFDGFRFTPLREYCDPPTAVVLFRHCHPPATDLMRERLEAFAQPAPAYAFHRLIDIVLSRLVHCQSYFEAFDDEQRARLAERMALLFELGESTVRASQVAVCLDPILSVYATDGHGRGGIDPLYRSTGDVGEWTEALNRFVRLLGSIDSPARPLEALAKYLAVTSDRPVDLGALRDVGRKCDALVQVASQVYRSTVRRHGAVLTPMSIFGSVSLDEVGPLEPSLFTSRLAA
jgi:hypothetical protein